MKKYSLLFYIPLTTLAGMEAPLTVSIPQSHAIYPKPVGTLTSVLEITDKATVMDQGRFQVGVTGWQQNFSREQAIEWLLPFSQDAQQTLLTQGRVSRWHPTGSKTLSLGIGQRRILNEQRWIGYNLFGDVLWQSGHHGRLSIGLEAGSRYLQIALNGYYPISGWKNHPQYYYAQRPARGVDVILNTYLPTYPHLRATIQGEHYFDQRLAFAQKRYGASNGSLTLHYTPIPLLTTSYTYQIGQQGFKNQRLHVNLQYRLGLPFKDHLDSTTVALERSKQINLLEPIQRCSLIPLTRKLLNLQTQWPALNNYNHAVIQNLQQLLHRCYFEECDIDLSFVEAILNTTIGYANQPDRNTVIPHVLSRAQEIYQMGSWNNVGGEVALALMVLSSSWPQDTALLVYTLDNNKIPVHRATYGHGTKQVSIINIGNHYQAYINGVGVSAGGSGDCFYHAVLHALGRNNTPAEVKQLRKDIATIYLRNPIVQAGIPVWDMR